MDKSCGNCEYKEKYLGDAPCASCSAECSEWKLKVEKSCLTCKYKTSMPTTYPCNGCTRGDWRRDLWEANA